ncbi:MAG TPA: DNA ligase D [Vicinamibacterales bacterium]|nr:DNA ligase D [Vicinamibacterales bacterium]
MPPWRDDPAKLRPMLASLDDPPLTRRGYVYEPKYDGIRAIVDVRPAAGRGAEPHVALYSRNGIDKTKQFPVIVRSIAALSASLAGPVVLDAEIVAIDRRRRPLGFGSIQGRIQLTQAAEIERAEAVQPCVLVVFDILRDGEEDLRGLPLAARRLHLQKVIAPRGKIADWIWLSEVQLDDGRAMLERAEQERWEGLIVKDGQSPYHTGRRTPAWRKLKITNQQELVVGGWTDPRQSRQHFGALVLGYYEAGDLICAGSVGTGFDQAELDRVAMLLEERATSICPFKAVPKLFARSHWVAPTLVVAVRFTEWTSDGYLRHPVYLGTRTDKAAKDVRRERAKRAETPAIETPQKPWRRASAAARAERVTVKAPSAPSRRSPRRAKDDAVLGGLIERLSTLEAARKDGELELPNGDTLRVTNLAKVFWPALKITKGDLLRYYVEVSPYLLPAVDDRPLVMKRFPNGIDKPAFYQQKHPETPPPGVRRERLPDDVEPIDEAEGERDRLIGGSLTTLLYMTQLAAISQDPWFSRVADPLHQDYTAIDLDPGEGAGFDKVLDVARWVHDELNRYGIPGVPKTSGSRGLHIYIPLPPKTTYETGQLLCQMIATIVATAHPRTATIERMVRRRPRGTVYVDYLQNILGKTLATAYSARASDYAGVSTPLTWNEVDEGLDPRDFTIRTAPARFAEVGDLWARLREGKPVDLRAVLRPGRGSKS